MDWPFYDPDLILLALFFFGGVVAAVSAFRMWKTIAHERRLPPDTLFQTAPPEEENYTSFQAGFVTLAAVVFILAGGLITVFTSAGKYQFRALPIDSLRAIEVNRATDEFNVDKSRTIRIENIDSKLSAGLKLLEKCGSQSREHEHFENGYVLHLIFDGPDFDNYYISVFRKSSSGRDKGIVIAQREPVRNLNLGEYSCPSFQDWIRQTIDPLFSETK